MRRFSWHIALGLALLAAAIAGFAVQFAVFHRESDTIFYLLQDASFLPIQVLIVTLVINRLLQIRERNELQAKTGMVVGIFFTEIGNTLLHYFAEFDPDLDEMHEIVDVQPRWTNRDFSTVQRRLQNHDYTIDCKCADLNDLKRLLDEKREFLLQLLANPSLLENTSFTRLLWSITHITQELELRPYLDDLPDEDYAHIASDMKRAYVLMVSEWLNYVRQIRTHQPYMFSLMVRMNPFERYPSPIVEDEENGS